MRVFDENVVRCRESVFSFRKSFQSWTNHEVINGFVHSHSAITSILFVSSIMLALSIVSIWLSIWFYLVLSASMNLSLERSRCEEKPSKMRLFRTLVSARPNSRHYRWSESACFSATRDTMLRQFQDSGACKHKKLNIRCRFVDHERVTSQMIW